MRHRQACDCGSPFICRASPLQARKTADIRHFSGFTKVAALIFSDSRLHLRGGMEIESAPFASRIINSIRATAHI